MATEKKPHTSRRIPSIEVRLARSGDIEWLAGELRQFAESDGKRLTVYGDGAHAHRGLEELVGNHLVLLAERVSDRAKLGFIAGMVFPHSFNPSIRVLGELLWWVSPTHRKTRAGLLLLDAFVAWGDQHCDWVTFGLQHDSPVRDETLYRRGFRPQERSFLRETKRCRESQTQS